MTTEQRRYSRIRFRGQACLRIAERSYPCVVSDLSLRGALLELEAPAAAPRGASCVLELGLDDGDTVVRMSGTVAHCEVHRLGMVCHELDLDSITHLRRLLALNLGDQALLDREFAALISQ